jgi:hypothetical protein
MKYFLKQLFYFIIIHLIILSGIFFIPDLAAENEILDDTVERKIAELVIDTNKINIIIAGDSRAERQLIPKIIKEITGFNTINIAANSTDLVTTATAIKKSYPSCSKIIFIISASSWQINDGAIDRGYLSLKCFQKMTFLNKLILFKNNLTGMSKLQIDLIQSFKYFFLHILNKKTFINYDANIIKELGYRGINGQLNVDLTVKELMVKYKLHPWYKNLSNNGIRWLIFKKALNEIGNMNTHFIIYQPPISPYWKTNTAKSFIDIAEKEYSNKMSKEIQKYNNLIFFDFYNNDIAELSNNMYYDVQHLNRQGAEIFSVYLSKKIMEVYKNKLYPEY